MKHRPDLMDGYAEEVNNFLAMLNGENNKTADDTYKKITAKGFYIVAFLLDRINDKLAFLIGFLIATFLFFR